MPRKQTKPPLDPRAGIARGNLQRVVLSSLLAGDTIVVPGRRGPGPRRPPCGMTARSWQAFRQRLAHKGYKVYERTDDYAGTYRNIYTLNRLWDEDNPAAII